MGVCGFVIINPSHRNLNGAGGNIIHKSTVVRDKHNCLSRVYQKILEPLHRIDVEVIGGLIEQDYIGILKQDFGQFDAHAPSATEFGRIAVEIFALETKPEKRFFNVFVDVGFLDAVKFFAQPRNFLNQLHVLIRVVVGTDSKLLVEVGNTVFEFVQLCKSTGSFFKYREAVVCFDMLRKVGNGKIFGS